MIYATLSNDAAARTIPSHPSSSLANLFTVSRKKLLLGPATPEILSKRLLDVVLFVHLDVDDVTSEPEAAKFYRLFEFQLSRGTSQISIIGPDFVISHFGRLFRSLSSCYCPVSFGRSALISSWSFSLLSMLSLSLFFLLGDNLWTGGMNGIEVTCNLFKFLFRGGCVMLAQWSRNGRAILA